jgi:hypothetical protein
MFKYLPFEDKKPLIAKKNDENIKKVTRVNISQHIEDSKEIDIQINNGPKSCDHSEEDEKFTERKAVFGVKTFTSGLFKICNKINNQHHYSEKDDPTQSLIKKIIKKIYFFPL